MNFFMVNRSFHRAELTSLYFILKNLIRQSLKKQKSSRIKKLFIYVLMLIPVISFTEDILLYPIRMHKQKTLQIFLCELKIIRTENRFPYVPIILRKRAGFIKLIVLMKY